MQKTAKAGRDLVVGSLFTRHALKRRIFSAVGAGGLYLMGMSSVLEVWSDFLAPGIILPFAGTIVVAFVTTPQKKAV